MVAGEEADGHEPVGLVSTISEARELAAGDFRNRIKDVENGNTPLCPARYANWVSRSAGDMVLTAIDPE